MLKLSHIKCGDLLSYNFLLVLYVCFVILINRNHTKRSKIRHEHKSCDIVLFASVVKYSVFTKHLSLAVCVTL
jgi:hypothetical protein